MGTARNFSTLFGSWARGFSQVRVGGVTDHLRSTAHVDGANPSTGTWRFYVHDHLGSTRGVYNSDKTQYAAFEHDPYGELYASSGSVSDITRRYTGHDWDDAAELYYAPYRYYAPGLARWLTRDPLGMVDGPNVYEYVRGNPICALDSTGLAKIPIPGSDKEVDCDLTLLAACLLAVFLAADDVGAVDFCIASCRACAAAPGPWNPGCWTCAGCVFVAVVATAGCIYASCEVECKEDD